MTAGLALALFLTLVVTLIWGVMDIREGHVGGSDSMVERAAISCIVHAA
jgi:hypothetical protein